MIAPTQPALAFNFVPAIPEGSLEEKVVIIVGM